MPTENRSNNTEMVSVPRQTLENVLRDGSCEREIHAAFLQAQQSIRTLLDQPAQQPHPEPIAWMVGTAIWWTKEEAERDSAETGLPIIGLGPMFDSRLVEQLDSSLAHEIQAVDRWKAEAEELRYRLAERDALPQFAQTVIRKLKRFRDCAEDGQGADIGKTWFDVLVQLGLLNRVQRSPAWWEITDEGEALLDGRAALSANEDPSTPAAQQGKCLDGDDCEIGGTCKWCPHTTASPTQQPS